MGLKFRYNDTIYSLVQLPPTPYYQEYINAAPALLCHREFAGQGNAIYKTPASEKQSEKVFLLTDSSSHQRVYMNTTSPTVHFRKDNKTYHCAKSFTYIDRKEVSYSSNGGSGSMDSQTFYPDDGESVTIKSNSFTAPGNKIFNGWNTSSDGAGTAYQPAAVYKGSSTLNLYAQWIFEYTKFSGSIVATSYSKSKLSTGSSGYYGATVRVTWSATVAEAGKNAGQIELRYSITNQGLVYDETKSGTWAATSDSSGNIATLLLDATSGNLNASPTLDFYLYDTKNDIKIDTASITLPSPWSFDDNSGSGGGGSTES